MTGHGYKSVSAAILSLQSTGAELLARHRSRISPVFETRSYLRRLEIDTKIESLKIVHVAGTKGKGSVSAFTESILRHSPYGRPLRTGLFTSPHLRDVTERIRIGGRPLPQKEFEDRFWRVFNRLYETQHDCGDAPPMPGFFRFFTVLAFDVFLAYNVDVAVFEVGIGGLLDPTNVIPAPIACGIASIGYDHCDVLGNTLNEIAFQKAGIIKPGCVAVTCVQPNDDVLRVIQAQAQRQQVPFHVVKPLAPGSVELGIGGEHQLQNAAIALRLAQILLDSLQPDRSHDDLLSHPEIRKALSSCKWPGRCQRLNVSDNLTLFIDGAHTAESCSACGSWFRIESAGRTPVTNVLVFNCAVNRNPVALLEALNLLDAQLHIDFVFSCPFKQERLDLIKGLPVLSDFISDKNAVSDFPEASTWQDTILHSWRYLCQYRNVPFPKQSERFSSVVAILERLHRMASAEPDTQFNVLVTGSLYLVGDTLDAVDYPVTETLTM